MTGTRRGVAVAGTCNWRRWSPPAGGPDGWHPSVVVVLLLAVRPVHLVVHP
ncbi:hypothetical protein GCM10017786_39910 [Amycolatopsis deserti]|uniref:Uncharacterized protein n=1 Tax=Amycolatopsis deserti TaxID=185696 RepID=A0ABQ3J755_9PSEU|nr:hypothetical protein [Amycolatopsis deserti]GHF02558.1 hypothetical protein GCM10017786_39910 [Amycolatopsis deserti]